MKKKTRNKKQPTGSRRNVLLVDQKAVTLENLKTLQSFTLMDDTFMSVVFQDIASTEEMIKTILKRSDIKVKRVITQNWIKNLQGRDVILDIYAIDENGKKYNVEVQRYRSGNHPKRTRYIGSLIDANITEPGTDFENIDEIYVIMITDQDMFGKNLPIYHVERYVEETGEPFGDELHIMYVNAQIQDDTKLGRLMHDFNCENPDDMYSISIKKRVKYFKRNDKGVIRMCEKMQKLIDEKNKELNRKNAINLYKTGTPIENIVAGLGVSRELILAWIEEDQQKKN